MRRRTIGTPAAQRWQVVGGSAILLAPIMAVGVGVMAVLLNPREDLPQVPIAIRIFLLIFTLGILALPLFLIWRAHRDWRRPSLPAGDLGPRWVARGAPGTIDSSASSAQVSPVDAPPLFVTVWDPARQIQLRQPRFWDRRPLIIAVLVAVGLFIAGPSYERGALAVGVAGNGWRVFGSWVLLFFIWGALPTLPRIATLDWASDRLDITYGRRRRTLGLSRVRGVELRIDEKNRKTGDQASGMIITHTIVVWVQPDGTGAVPFVLTESAATHVETASEAAHRHLVGALAAALNVPAARPRDAADVKPYH